MRTIPFKEGESVDGLLRNKFRVIQAEKGYRVSEDALILAWFFKPRAHEFILDVGAGCGVIAFALCMKEPSVTVVGLEIQAGLCDRAGRGVRLNGLESRVSIIRGDVRDATDFFRPGVFDAVICNPPYHGAGRGRISALEEKALARHQLMMPPADLFGVAAYLLKPEGRVTLIYPSWRLDQIKKVLRETGFKPSRMLWIHPRKGAPPSLICIEARSEEGWQGLIEDALFLYDSPQQRSRLALAILEGEEIAVT